MAVIELYSKRQKKLRGEVPDVFTYDEIPDSFRVQVVQILQDALGSEEQYRSRHFYDEIKGNYKGIVHVLRREYGVFSLLEYGRPRNEYEELRDFLLGEKDVERFLDAVDLAFKCIHNTTRNWEYMRGGSYETRADRAIAELNIRFKEHGLGYQFEKEILRVDNQVIHQEAVKPALQLLSSPDYSGPQEEFLSAYEHYRHSNYKEALTDALKSLESTMKVICGKRGWKFDEGDTAKRLLDICFDKDLIPSFWQNHMGGLRAILEGGVPTARNKLGGHGQGEEPVDVPEHIVSYVLHITASTIVFLVKAERT